MTIQKHRPQLAEVLDAVKHYRKCKSEMRLLQGVWRIFVETLVPAPPSSLGSHAEAHLRGAAARGTLMPGVRDAARGR